MSRPIYNNETIEQFIKRYSKEIESQGIEGVKKKTMSMYLIKKGRKLANVIQMQYYMNIIRDELDARDKSGLWDDKVRNDFMIKAKETFKKQKTQYDSIWDEYVEREGLYKLAEDYLNELLNRKLNLKEPPVAAVNKP